MLLIIGFLDTIIKAFQYGGIFIVPTIIVIIILIFRRKRRKNQEVKAITNAINIFAVFLVLVILSSRIWGPVFYKSIMRIYIDNKQDLIEQKLEKKYNKNFTFISKDEIKIEKYSGSTLGQDINNDYSILYRFKDDDDVIAIVEYKKNGGWDYYESKRSKYDIENCVYNYANKIDFEGDFYVFVESRYESIGSSTLDGYASNNYIADRRKGNYIYFISTQETEENKNLMIKSLNTIFRNSYAYVYEYVVNDEEYRRAVEYYE